PKPATSRKAYYEQRCRPHADVLRWAPFVPVSRSWLFLSCPVIVACHTVSLKSSRNRGQGPAQQSSWETSSARDYSWSTASRRCCSCCFDRLYRIMLPSAAG